MSEAVASRALAGPAAGTPPRRYLGPTPLLDFEHPRVAGLVAERGWAAMPEADRIAGAYAFVRDEVPFGYNAADDLPASRVLADGYGQCNTKATLLMALLRGVGVPCRAHFFTIYKALQLGAVPKVVHGVAPAEVVHSWVEVWHGGRWLELEGFILDRPYLARVQAAFRGHQGAFCGYGVATPDLAHPPVEWTGGNTYIQREGIARDLGVFDAPDDFYRAHGGNLRGVRRLLYRWIVRHAINRHVRRIRRGALALGATSRDAARRWLPPLYATTATLLVAHEVDAGVWREWTLLRLPGGAPLFVLLHLPLVALCLDGYRRLLLGRPGGAAFALVFAAAGLVTPALHAALLAAGTPQFRALASLALLAALVPVSLAQSALALRVLRAEGRRTALPGVARRPPAPTSAEAP